MAAVDEKFFYACQKISEHRRELANGIGRIAPRDRIRIVDWPTGLGAADSDVRVRS